MFRSATFKLTVWYLAIVMAISLIFSFALYSVTTRELSRGLNRESQRISSQFPVFQGNPILAPPQADYNSGAHRIFWRLVAFNVIVLGGAGLASYWLARRTLEPIEQAHEQQKRFTADVSHELRTPLTALKMEVEVALMNDKNGKKELRQTLASNLEEANKLEDLINNLLRLTRLEAEEIEQQFEPIDSNEIIKDALARVKTAVDDKDIKLVDASESARLNGDKAGLVQLAVILLDNAIKYSPPGSEVRVSSEANEQVVTLRFIDHGYGIGKQALDHAFDRFYRGTDESRNKAASEGFGLGLSIAKMIADLHGGSITISSQKGYGTTVMVSLPIATEAQQALLNQKAKDWS